MTEDTSVGYEPEYILDPTQYDEGFIWIPNWEEYQHTDVIKAGVSMRWHRCLTKTLDNRRYRSLSMSQRGLFHGLLMLCSRVGQGRVDAHVRDLRGQLGDPSKHLRGSRDALVHAGLVAIVSRRAPEGFMMRSSTEEKRIEKKERSARESDSPNGVAPHAHRRKLKCPEHHAELIGSHDYWQCPAPACRYRSTSRWVGGDPIASILPDLGRP